MGKEGWNGTCTCGYNAVMNVNPYESPRPLLGEPGDPTLKDSRWSLTLTGFFAGGYVGAWVGSLSGAGVGVLLALFSGVGAVGFRDPAFAFVENLVSTGLLLAILGTLAGGGVGATLGLGLGVLVAVSGDLLRKTFVWLSCLAAGVTAMTLAAAMFRFDTHAQEWRSLGDEPWERFVYAAAVGVVGLGGLFGGGLLGRILREIAWEPGEQSGVADEDAGRRIGGGAE